MSLQKATDFANEIQACYLATSEGNQPRVRGFLLWFADENGFYFSTSAAKDVGKQLKNNPQVEVCFYKNDPKDGKMLRVSGKIEFVDDTGLKTRLLDEKPFLKDVGFSVNDPNFLLFRIAHGEAHFWAMGMNEKDIPRIAF